MKTRIALVTFALAIVAGMPAAVDADPRHDFDFQFGTWRVHVERLLQPPGRPPAWVAYDGTHVVRKVWGGRANVGELEVDGPAGHIEGVSLRLYDARRRRWNVTFANSRSATLGPPMTGTFAHGRGVFYEREVIGGRNSCVRSVTSDIRPGSYRDEQAESSDGGKTWRSDWIATFRRDR